MYCTRLYDRFHTHSLLRMCFLFLFFIAAFMCHHNTFLVYQSMRNATLERWEKVTHISIGFAWVVAALFGIAGYATFRALSQGIQSDCHSMFSGNGYVNDSFFYRFRRFTRKLLLGRRSNELLSGVVLDIDSVNISHRMFCFERGKNDGN